MLGLVLWIINNQVLVLCPLTTLILLLCGLSLCAHVIVYETDMRTIHEIPAVCEHHWGPFQPTLKKIIICGGNNAHHICLFSANSWVQKRSMEGFCGRYPIKVSSRFSALLTNHLPLDSLQTGHWKSHSTSATQVDLRSQALLRTCLPRPSPLPMFTMGFPQIPAQTPPKPTTAVWLNACVKGLAYVWPSVSMKQHHCRIVTYTAASKRF